MSTMALTSALARSASEGVAPCKFVYRRAIPAVRWPHIEHFQEKSTAEAQSLASPGLRKMSSLSEKPKPKNRRQKIERISDAICGLEEHEFASDIIEGLKEELNASDSCCLLKRVATSSWQRALEVFECLNVERWYSPDPRMLATMLSILGKASQGTIAQQLFGRSEPGLGGCVQVYNAMMSVYACSGDWDRVEKLLARMQAKGCQPDLVTFNIVIKAHTRRGMQDGVSKMLIQDIYKAGFKPDTITYNTLISSCAFNNRLTDAIDLFEEMQKQGCEVDVWTYNSMISVYGRAGKVEAAIAMFKRMQDQGLAPDAVTFNSLLYAFAKACNVEEVDRIKEMMEAAGYAADEITYNTMIHMYGKLGLHQKAETLYKQMRDEGRCPDAVTFTVLIDSLGKAGLVNKAAVMFEALLESQVQPTLESFSAMICAYAKAGSYDEAERTYGLLLRSGVRPDVLAHSVMLDVFFKAGMIDKCILVYKTMIDTGLKPEMAVYCLMVRVYFARGMQADLEQLGKDITKFSSVGLAVLSSSLCSTGFRDEATVVLKLALDQGLAVRPETMEQVLSALEASEKYTEARSLVSVWRGMSRLSGAGRVCNKLVSMLAKAGKLKEAEEELTNWQGEAPVADIYKILVREYRRAGKYKEATRKFLDMVILGLELDADTFKSALISLCKSGLPGIGFELLEDCVQNFAEAVDEDVVESFIESYAGLKQWQNAEFVFTKLQAARFPKSDKPYKALLLAYTSCGRYNQAQETLEEMARSGVQPSIDCVNNVLQALAAGSTSEMLVLYQRLRKWIEIVPNLQTYVITLSSLARNGSLEAARSVYEEMKNSGYAPNVQLFKALLSLYGKGEDPQGAEKLLSDMKQAGHEPDLEVYNTMINMYSRQGNYEQAVVVFKGMQQVGCLPDASTYNTLITLYCQHEMVQEARSFLQQMIKEKKTPWVASFTTLISSYGRLHAYEEAEAVFQSMLWSECKPDMTAYNVMINVFRKAGNYEKVEEVIAQMKAKGLEPDLTTVHMLMDSYGKAGEVVKAAGVLEDLPELGISVEAIHYTSLIDAQLKSKDYLCAVKLLKKMQEKGVRPTYVTISCFIGAASLCEKTSHALALLKALAEAGFSLPLRLLTEKGHEVLKDTHDMFDQLEEAGPEAAQGVVNVIIDLLWAFRQCATASHVFSAAVEKCIYPRVVARVQEKSWGADLRNLSPGAALVALILWLDRMQDASLQGVPEAPRVVYIRTGCNLLNNHASVSKTIKQHLYQMGSPFLPSKSRQGILGAKGHSVCLWLKDSPYCLDLELKDTKTLPEESSIRVHNGAFMWAGLVEAVQEIEDNMGEILPKKFCRLVHLTPKGRATSIKADLQGRAEKLAKDLKRKLSRCSAEEEERKRYHRLRKSGKMRQQPKGAGVPRGYEQAGRLYDLPPQSRRDRIRSSRNK